MINSGDRSPYTSLPLEELLTVYRQASDEEASCYSLTPKLLNTSADITNKQSDFLDALDGHFKNAACFEKETIVYRGGTRKACMNETNGIYPAFLPASLDITEAVRFCKEDDDALFIISCSAGVPYIPVALKTNRAVLEPQELLLPRNLYWKINNSSPFLSETEQLALEMCVSPSCSLLHINLTAQ